MHAVPLRDRHAAVSLFFAGSSLECQRRFMSGTRHGPSTRSLFTSKEYTGFNAMKNRTLGRDALEMIMRDVLEGLQGFTQQASLASRRDGVGNECPNEKPSARIIYLQRRFQTH
jgi:hypothetical protein